MNDFKARKALGKGKESEPIKKIEFKGGQGKDSRNLARAEGVWGEKSQQKWGEKGEMTCCTSESETSPKRGGIVVRSVGGRAVVWKKTCALFMGEYYYQKNQ